MRLAVFLFAFFAFILLLPLFSAETSVYSGWFHSGDSFTVTIDGKEEIHYLNYFIYERKNDAVNKLFWKRGTKGMTFSLGDCKTDAFYQFCFTDVSWKDSKEGGQLIYQHGEEYPGIKIEISKFGPDVQVARDSSEGTSLNIYQESRINVKITNGGDRRADIVYQDFPPSIVTYYDPQGISPVYPAGYYEWDGFLYPAEFASMYYMIKPITYESFTIPAYMNFSYQGRTSVVSVSPLAFSITKPYSFSADLSPASGKLYDLSDFTISFSNDDKYRSMKAHVGVNIPKELDILEKPTSLVRQGDLLVFDILLAPGKDYSFFVTVRGGATGTHNISAYAEFDFGHEQFVEKYSAIYSIISTTLTPKLRLIHPSVEGGTKVRLVAELENMDEMQNLRDIAAEVSGPLLEEPVKIRDPLLGHGALTKYVDEYLTTPITNANLEYKFWFNGTYKIASEEKFNFSTFAILTVNAAGGDLFSIEHELSQETVAPGANVTVKTFVKNLKDYNAFKVDSQDVLPPGVPVAAGINKKTFDLDANEKKQAYLYMIHVPEDYKDSSLPIMTKIKFQEYDIERESALTVIVPIIESPSNDTGLVRNDTNATGNITREQNGTGNPPPGDLPDNHVIVERGKENFLVKLFRGLGDFLAKIF